MDFFSKFTKPDQSKPASEPNSTTEPSNTDLFSSAKVVAGAAQSYFSNQPEAYKNAEVAGATADILDAASEYGKMDKTQGVGKYVDQAESYLKQYEASNTTAPASAPESGVKSSPTTEAADTETAATKGAAASTEESTKTGSHGEDKTEGLSSKPPAVDATVESDTTYEKRTEGDLPKKPAAAATGASEDYAKEGISEKLSSGGTAAEADSGDPGYAEEGLQKPPAGGVAAGDDASNKVSPAEGGFGNFTKVAGNFLNK